MDIKSMKVYSYDEIRGKLKTGDLLLFSGDYFFSKLVKFFTKSQWSHIASLIVDKELNRVMIYESVERHGTRFIPLSKYLNEYKGLIIVKRHKDWQKINTKVAEQIAYDTQGGDYDKRELYRIAARQILTKLGIKKLFNITFNPNKNNLDICSEEQKNYFDALGLSIPYNSNGSITPADFGDNQDFNFIARLK